MRFIKATIYGFGKWVDYSIDFTDELAIIYGENESGKSTIQRFILFMLFGLPPKQRAYYQPKQSGKMGGRLTVYDAEIGEFTIERQDTVRSGAAICYTEDGREHNQAWLQERLSGMNLQTYQSIFSFSATDLSFIQEMKEEDLSDILLSIGLTGSTTIHNLEKQLESSMLDLFRPTGKKPEINKQLNELDERLHSLRNFRENEETYREKKTAIDQLKEQVEQLQFSLNEAKAARYRVEKQLQALPIFSEYQQYTSSLTSYPMELEFPEEGIERLEKVKEGLLPLQSQLSVLQEAENQYKLKLQSIQDERMEDVYKEAQEILEEKESGLDYYKELKKIESTLEKVEVQLEAEINRLNIGISREELSQLTFPFHVEKKWIELKNNANQMNAEKQQLRLEENQLKQERNYLLNQLQMLEDEKLSEEKLQKLNRTINDYKENDLLHRLQTDALKKKQEWQRTKKTKMKSMNNLLLICIGVALLAVMLAVFTERALFMYVMLTFLLGGGLQWIFRKYTMKEMERMMTGANYSHTSNQHSEREIEDAEHLLAAHHSNLREIELLETKIKDNEINRLKFLDAKHSFKDKEARLHSLIENEYENYPFLNQVEIMYWPELYHSLKHLLSLVKDYQQELENRSQISDNLMKFEFSVNQFFARNNWEINANHSLIDKLGILESFVVNELEMAGKMNHYCDLLKDNDKQQQELRQKIKTYEKEIGILFENANVETEDSFYKKAKQSKEKTEINRLIERTINQLQMIFSKQEWEQYVENNLDAPRLEAKYNETKEKIVQIEKEINICREELAAIQASIALMESSESYSDSLYHFEMEKEQLNKLAKEWSILKIAMEMLLETKREYRDKYLPKVIEKTSIFFQELTGNTYCRVYAPNEDKPFQVELESGIRFSVDELSQGTIDQLYVALRLATSLILSENHRLPFIIDDAFVHFDSVRTKRMMRIMESIATDQQVIIFTCKKEVVDASQASEMIPLSNIM
ncbi:ATP-binding protein [Oceanobacillus chungangensis]|uniref:ATP-binding protein n=1 Tax=Oceanobacillus chungangensis TaxID=1229152 RepID=UPI00147396E3|nr:AAA family ATPase [Oceanobacillus chungangensis]